MRQRTEPGPGDFDARTASRFDRTPMAHDGIRARHTSTCPLCRTPIRKGVDHVVRNPTLGRYVHEMCPLPEPRQ